MAGEPRDRGPETDAAQGSGFWRRGPPEEREPLREWAAEPRHHALVLVTLGFFGVFLEQSNFLFQLVVGAPVFEELLKFGVVLGLASLAGIRSRPLRFGLALAVGAAFGGLEHAITYPKEPLAALRFRLAFHAGTPALSVVVYDAVAEARDVRIRWTATWLSTVVHWVNNMGALALGVVGLAVGEVGSTTALRLGQASAGTVVGLAVAGLLLPEVPRRVTLAAWDRFTPWDRAPEAPVGDPRARDPPDRGR